MDWIRRNWPDLFLGITLIAVIAGIVVTLLGGGTLPFGRQTAPAESTREATVPDRETVEVAPIDPDAPQEAVVVEDDELDNRIADSDANDAIEDDVEGENDIVPIDPDALSEADTSPAAPDTDDALADADAPPSEALEPDDVGAPYRVSVGAFSTRDRAEVLSAEFREQGYPVFVGRQGDFYLAALGPYRTQAEAEAARDQVRSEGSAPDAYVYALQRDPLTSGQLEELTPDTTTEVESVEVADTETVEEASDAGPSTVTEPRYLQVGAFVSSDLAAPRRERLESLGYEVSVQDDGSLVRLLIGPFEPDELAAMQARLETQGIENFVR